MRLARVVVLAALVSCQQRTEILFGIVTDLKAPDAFDTVQLTITRTSDGFVEENVPFQISGQVDVPLNLPGSFGMTADSDNPPTIQVDVQGLKTQGASSTLVVDRTAILTLVPGQTLFYRMGLTAGCASKGDCGPGMSCVEGVCRDQHVDNTTLPAFDTSFVDNLTCDSGIAYVDTDTDTPMTFTGDATDCPSNQCSEGTCYLPPTKSGNGPDAGFGDGGTIFPDGPVKDSGGGSGGGADCTIQPRLYSATWNCQPDTCTNGYPGMTGSIQIDASGQGDYVADPTTGIDGTCNVTLGGACNANITCNITTNATGNATGAINFGSIPATGSIGYQLNTPMSCTASCMLTLQ